MAIVKGMLEPAVEGGTGPAEVEVGPLEAEDLAGNVYMVSSQDTLRAGQHQIEVEAPSGRAATPQVSSRTSLTTYGPFVRWSPAQ